MAMLTTALDTTAVEGEYPDRQTVIARAAHEKHAGSHCRRCSGRDRAVFIRTGAGAGALARCTLRDRRAPDRRRRIGSLALQRRAGPKLLSRRLLRRAAGALSRLRLPAALPLHGLSRDSANLFLHRVVASVAATAGKQFA